MIFPFLFFSIMFLLLFFFLLHRLHLHSPLSPSSVLLKTSISPPIFPPLLARYLVSSRHPCPFLALTLFANTPIRQTAINRGQREPRGKGWKRKRQRRSPRPPCSNNHSMCFRRHYRPSPQPCDRRRPCPGFPRRPKTQLQLSLDCFIQTCR